MDDQLMQRMRRHVTKSEGTILNPYKDTNGKLTVGTGFLVDDEKSFVGMPLEILDSKTGEMRPATDAEKKAEFTRAKALPATELNKGAGKSKLSLPTSDDRRILDTEITTRVDKVKTEIGETDWNKLTDGQKTALVDIHYANGKLEKFTKLKEAVKSDDAKTMAEQSDFHGGKMDGTDTYHRNFDRIRRNRAEMQGIDPESPEAYRAVADKYRGHPSLNDNYKKHASPGGSTPQPERSGQRPQAPTAGGGTTIQPGDTLSKIAARHGVSAEELAKANGITDPNRIRAGQSLTIPGQAPQAPSPQEIESRILDGKVTPVTGNTATPPPTASEWPKVDPAAFPGTGNGSTPEQKQSEPPADPKMAALMEMAGSPVDNPGKSALLKPVERLTQSEMTDMINSAQGDYRGWRSGDPLKAHTYEKVQDWHVAMYGDGPQANDGGKPVDPTPIRAIPDQPSPHVTPQGGDLWQATGKLGGKVAEAAQIDGADNAVKSLQRGLNMLNGANPLPARSAAYAPYTKFAPVDEDGAYGPQTDFALKHAAARLGPAKVEEAFALGRFNTFAREAQRNGNAEGLEDRTHSVFGPLFRGTADTKSPKMEGGVLQETLNDLGPRSHDDWTPLKVDNWIGPKTTEAFGKLLKSEDSDGLTAAFGRGLGFL